MAWIKLQTTLARSAKVMQFAAALRMRRREALGMAMEWFCWVDAQCADGCTGLYPAQVDDVLDCKRLAEALIAVGWAYVGADGFLYVDEFEKHHGEGAKTRALNAERAARFKAGRSNAGSVTGVTDVPCTLALPREREDNNTTVVGRYTGDVGSNGRPAPPQLGEDEEGFRVWLAGLCSAHPSASRSRVLQPDVLAAARNAYKRVPDAVRYVDLLGAYYASKKAEDRFRKAFYKPTGQRKYFDDLEDVLCHAERWAKEFGYGKRRKQSTVAKAAEGSGELVGGAEAMAFIRGERDEL